MVQRLLVGCSCDRNCIADPFDRNAVYRRSELECNRFHCYGASRIWYRQPAPLHSYLTAIGLNTLGLRMERHMANAIAVADFLNGHPKVEWVNFPGFEDHICHDIARAQFNNKGFGAMLTFGLKNQETCFKFIDHLDMILNIANLGDCKTLIIHPYSSQYISFSQDLKDKLADPKLLRFSLGVEHPEDICNDLAQALDAV